MPRLVRDDGTGRERIVVIGEAPGTHENARGIPFVGPAGQKLAAWQRRVGLDRRDCYWTNVYPYQPPKNKIELVPPGELEPWVRQLHDRLSALSDPWVLVPTGNTALRALVGKSKITKHRGSIYAYRDRRGRDVKVIPTIHPAAIFRTPGWERRCLHDWARIADDATFRDLRLPEREHFIKPTWTDLTDYLADAQARAEILALDIETPRELILEETKTKRGKTRWKKRLGEARITCVGFAFEPTFSMTIPTTESYWAQQAVPLADVWDLIRQLCCLPCEKAKQNGLFDAWWLALPEYNVPVRNWRWDTRGMSHCRDATDDHDLAYQASIYTREPYWKDEAKDPDEMSRHTSDVEAFYTYNGKDTAVTRELVDVHHSRLGERGLLGDYDRRYWRKFQPLLRLMRHGVAMDDPGRRRRYAMLKAQCIAIQDKLTALAGGPLYGPKGSLSTKKLAAFLYERLNLPKQFDRATGKLTTKEVVVRRLMLKYPQKLGSAPLAMEKLPVSQLDGAGPLILVHRRKQKLSEFLADSRVDPDGRYRSSYGPYAVTGRLTCSKNPRRTGGNAQNTDRDVRDAFIPDPGCFFLEVDLSTAESRCVYCLTGDPALIAYAQSKPWEFDDHRRTATIVFNLPADTEWNGRRVISSRVDKDQRYFAKHTRHAAHYGERGRRMSDNLLKEGIVRTADECDRWLDSLLAVDRGIPDWHRQVRQQVLRDRTMGNSWGHTVDWTYERLSDDLYRMAYAWQPQSEIQELLNQWGFIPLDRMIQRDRLRSRINVNMHDSLLISTTLDEAYDIAAFLRESLERPRTYGGVKCSIPTELKCGTTWQCSLEFKRLPSRAEFATAVREMLKGAKVQAA